MSDTKISALTELAVGDVDRANDVLPIVDIGAGSTKKIKVVSLLNISTMANTLSGDVALNNTANYFTGPTVAQGTSGTWFASGGVQLTDTAGAAGFDVKLWDGTTVIASSIVNIPAASADVYAHLSGFIVSPAGNIRISVKDVTSTSGAILFNESGESKDSTITVMRTG